MAANLIRLIERTPAGPLWREIAATLLAGEPVALATVVKQQGSAPRPEGATLMVRSNGSILGAVSAGCLEADVVEHCLAVLADGQTRLQHYSAAAGEDPLSLGLSCGGSLELVLERWIPEQLPVLEILFQAVAEDRFVALASGLGPNTGLAVSTGSAQAHWGTNTELPELLAEYNPNHTPSIHGRPWPAQAWPTRTSRGHGAVIRIHQPATPLWIFGATETANALCLLARPLGFRSTVVDARPAFATVERCPAADQVICAWPHHWLETQTVTEATVICVLNHDPKFEIPLLTQALRSAAPYVGAMGSRSTHRQRLSALREAGLNQSELDRLRAPIGLDLGGRTDAELALSILAEVVMLRHQGRGTCLKDGQGPIHQR